jgi:serine/threonine-protein kinase RsbW
MTASLQRRLGLVSWLSGQPQVGGPAAPARGAGRAAWGDGGRYPGRLDQAAQVREFLTGLLRGCPASADVILLTDELVSNALLHSESRRPGGGFSVRADIRHGESVRVEVADAGGQWTRRSRDSSRPGGRGLMIVQALAGAWGVTGDDNGRTVWFVTGWNVE